MSILNSAALEIISNDLKDILYTESGAQAEAILQGVDETLAETLTLCNEGQTGSLLYMSIKPTVVFRRAGKVIEYGYDDNSLPFKVEHTIIGSCVEVHFEFALKVLDVVLTSGDLTVVYDVDEGCASHVLYTRSHDQSTLDFEPKYSSCTSCGLTVRDMSIGDAIVHPHKRFDEVGLFVCSWLEELVNEVNDCVYDNNATGHANVSIHSDVA